MLMFVLIPAMNVQAHPETRKPAAGGGLTCTPLVAYTFLIPEDGGPITAAVLGDIGIKYLLPLTEDGDHNLVVGSLGGGSPGEASFTNAGFKLGWAYAPQEVENIVFGIVGVFDAMFPSTTMIERINGEEVSREAWICLGVEGSLDFTVPGGFPGSLVVGWTVGLRRAPDKFYFAFSIPMRPIQAEETVKRSL